MLGVTNCVKPPNPNTARDAGNCLRRMVVRRRKLDTIEASPRRSFEARHKRPFGEQPRQVGGELWHQLSTPA